MKTTDFPAPVRDFARAFAPLVPRYEIKQVFDDFLIYMINKFSPNLNPSICAQAMERYTPAEAAVFADITHIFCKSMEREVAVNPWCDLLGQFYECVASNSTKDGLGQFFTPVPVCDLMAQMNKPEPRPDGKRVTIADPCAGSGRLLLATNAIFPGAEYFAQDINQTCANMCAINMMMHGLTGQVTWGNSLTLETFGGYYINSLLYAYGLPSIHVIYAEPDAVQAQEPEPAPPPVDFKQEIPAPEPLVLAEIVQESFDFF
jgi:type I restriction enzyme M protein